MSGRGGIARGPGPRSMEALRWLARVDVAGVEALGVALGFSRSVTYSHVARLEEAGLLVRAFAHGGSVVAITASGRRAVGADRAKLRAGATHGMGLRHARAISWVAALLTLRDRDWVSERAMRACDEWTVPVLWAAPARAPPEPGHRHAQGRDGGRRGRALAQVSAPVRRDHGRLRALDRSRHHWRRVNLRLRPRRRSRRRHAGSAPVRGAGESFPRASARRRDPGGSSRDVARLATPCDV